MRSTWLVVVLGVMAVGCQCGPGPAPVAGEGGGAGGGAAGGGSAGGGGGSLGGGAGGGGGGDVDAGGDDAGLEDAGVDAGIDAGCVLSVAPAALMFGNTAPGCASREVLSVSNRCSADESISFVTTGPFSVELDGGALLVAAGSTAQIPFLFQPTDAGAVTGNASVTSAQNVIDVPLSGLGELSPIVTDTFRQPNRVRANLLFVISDGPGMVPAQQSLATNFPAMVQYAAANQFDFRIGVLAGRLDGGTLVGGVMTQNRPNLVQQFVNAVSLGASGTPTGSCLERAVQELSDGGAAWLFPRAPFSLVCVQNTPETLTGTVPAALQTLSTLVGNPAHFTVDALANFEPGCPPPDDVTLRGAVDATRGSAVSICPGADGGIAPVQGRLLGDYENTFALSRKRAATATLQVLLDGNPVPPINPSTMMPVWTYDAALNAIVFESIAAPQPGSVVVVRYSPACTP